MSITFLVQSESDDTDVIRFACRQIDSLYEQGHRLWVTGSESLLTSLHSTLWSFRQNSFIPHLQLFDDERVPESHALTPIILATTLPDNHDFDIAFNIGENQLSADDSIMAKLQGNEFSLVEIVPHSEQLKKDARLRFKAYRQLGIEPEMQKLVE